MWNIDWLTDDMLYKGGIVIAAAAVIILLFYIVISRIFISKVKKKLTKEYGEIVTNKRITWQK